MKKLLPLLLFVFAVPAFGQTAVPGKTFSVNLAALSLPGNGSTVAGVDAGTTFNVTQNLQMREDNLLSSDGSFKFFGGGFNYFLPPLSKLLNNKSPNLNGSDFLFWITASVGVDHIAAAQHYAFRAGGGLQYKIKGSNTWAFGIEPQYARFPGLKNNTWTVAAGPVVHF